MGRKRGMNPNPNRRKRCKPAASAQPSFECWDVCGPSGTRGSCSRVFDALRAVCSLARLVLDLQRGQGAGRTLGTGQELQVSALQRVPQDVGSLLAWTLP